MKLLKLRAVIDVTYDPKGETEDAIKRELDFAIDFIANRGLLTGNTKAEVVTWKASVGEQPRTGKGK